MHVASPSSRGASDVVTGDDTEISVIHLSLVGCVSPIDRTKIKVYLTLFGHHVHMGDFLQIKRRYSTNPESIFNVLIKEV